ncbi:chaperone NapD [Flavobacteriaceae bacterium XHP0103]|uniref:chaperone NapD n=1 Tax=Marixanthotalea marina TaxID=2844359 RepID=UPI00298A03B6|nr:chaperone NapD [Marixanthotalea marina]MBU3821647.1 chaperone NapD [Marixanthotalea marina]
MPIKSYLAHPHSGRKESLAKALNTLSNCEVIPAENENLLIVVTETDNQEQEDKLKQTIESLEDLKLMAMVSGFDVPKDK